MTLLLGMAGVWATTDGKEIEVTERVQVGGGIIPKDSKGIATISKITLDSLTNRQTNKVEDLVNIVWKFTEGEDTKGKPLVKRTCFQKLRLWDEDEGKANNARLMLTALDNILTGGEMRKAELDIDKETLQLLKNDAEALITVGVWNIDGKEGNFVQAVAPATDYEAPEEKEETSAASDTRPVRTPRTPR